MALVKINLNYYYYLSNYLRHLLLSMQSAPSSTLKIQSRRLGVLVSVVEHDALEVLEEDEQEMSVLLERLHQTLHLFVSVQHARQRGLFCPQGEPE